MALLGSTLGFMMFHVGWANPLQMGAIFLVGFIFGLIRLRAEGILGLIILHGLYDIINVELYRNVERSGITLASITKPWLAVIGDILGLSLIFYLLFIHPKLVQGRATPK